MSPRSAVLLIVEDDRNDIWLLSRALEKAAVPYPVRIARDGQAAIDYLSGAGEFRDRDRFPVPCLVILDLELPRKNGIEVLQWLRGREDFRDLPVVMMASTAEEDEKEVAAHNGVEGFHVKCVDFEALVGLAKTIRLEADEHCRDARPCPSENESEL